MKAFSNTGRPVPAQSPDAVAWSLEGALYCVVSDPDADGIAEAEWWRREALASAVFKACGVDLMAFNEAAHRQDVVIAVRRCAHAP
ncbi:hypothetical protein MKK70_25345 [Methylobacterium sp. E-041]|uniref:hypothetical protein n=1 Tax=Methylobacterium sp. E-041 TaxID=2836573 RepID=UPI001FBBC203|nr:hypothetical protein [Methylobacterium sp. E-041]MCJ2108638.1 hypothetical protein [Methylobacterium sp. E-041]